MEAKDTVMSEEQIKELLGEFPIAIDYLVADIISKAQASLSFKAGIKEVVNWIKSKAWQGFKPAHGFDPLKGYLIREGELEGKLQEWGIEQAQGLLEREELMINAEQLDKVRTLIDYVSLLFSTIRGAWTDPRWECREGWEAVGRLRRLLDLSESEGYRHRGNETDDEYFKRIALSVEQTNSTIS